MATIGKPQNSRTKYLSKYSQTLLYGQFALSLWKENPYIFTIKFQPA